MSMGFNESGEKPTFIYKKDEQDPFRYEIHAIKHRQTEYSPVGDYKILDKEESPELTEKKIINLTKLLNGKGDLMDLSHLTNTRMLFNIEQNVVKTDPTVIIFRSHNGKGVSEENAVLTLDKGVLNDR